MNIEHPHSSPPYYTYRRYMIDTYGSPLFRVPIDTGHGCPNRGPDGSGGCTFCAEDGGRSQQTQGRETLEEQIAAGVAFSRRRYDATRFLAYVQAYTGTFASVPELRATLQSILTAFSFDALSIGTRPDCLKAETLEFLGELAGEVELWVELGVQTVHDATLRRVRRGHDWNCSRDAILALESRGIKVAPHVIIGLPGETEEHFRATAVELGRLPIAAVKIHNLHVIEGTRLAEEFGREPFTVYDEYEYVDLLIDFMRRLPPRLPIMRIVTDTPRDRLAAPRWGMSKVQFIPYVIGQMQRRGVKQGDLA